MDKVQELQQRLEQMNGEAMTIRNKADHEKRDLTDDELAQVQAINESYEKLMLHIDVLTKAEDNAVSLAAGAGRRTDPEGPVLDANDDDTMPSRQVMSADGAQSTHNPRVSMRYGFERDSGKFGFASLGDFAYATRMAGSPTAQHVDKRLRVLMDGAPSTPANSDGTTGFLIPPDFRQSLVSQMYAEDSLLARTNQITTATNNITLRIDEETPWGDEGIQVYWGRAGRKKQESNLPEVEPRSYRLNELYAMVPIEDDHLDDAPALDGLLRLKAPQKMNWAINRAIISGSGVGQPTGILNHKATVTVGKEAAQTPGTFVFQNAVNMWARMPQRCRSASVWLTNSDIEPQLMTMQFPTSAGTTAVPAYMPPGGASATPYGTLLGRPVIAIESGEGLGQRGDIMFVDLTQYLTVMKGTAPKVDVSIHLYFDYDVTAYRFVFRITGRPWWGSAIKRPAAGALDQSYAVVLEERA